MRVDPGAGTVFTGGAPPPADPLGQGFCFADFALGATKVAPVTLRVHEDAGALGSVDRQDVNIPIFLTLLR